MVRTREPVLRGQGRPARERLLALFVALVLVTTLFSGATTSVPRAAAGGTTITALVTGDPFYYQLVKVLPQFEKATGITVNLESVSYDQMHGQLVNAAITHSSSFDVVCPDAMWVSEFVDNGWIDQLDSYVKADKAEVQPGDLIPQVVWSMDEWKGHLYALPLAAYGMDVLYRTDVFSALHLTPPPATAASWWTWDQYLKDVHAINGQTVAGTKYYGTVIAGAQQAPIVHMYTQLAASLGARWFKAFPSSPKWDFTVTLNSPANLKALSMFTDLYHNSPPQADAMNWFEAGTQFSLGKVGMFYWWTPYNYLVDKAGYEVAKDAPIVGKYSVGVLPSQPGVPQTMSDGGWSLGISSFSHKKDAAFKFIAWATSAKTQLAMALEPGYQFSDFAHVSNYKDASANAAYPYLTAQLNALEAGNGKAVRPPIPIYTVLEGLYGTALNEAIRGASSPADTLTTVTNEFNSVLSDDAYIPYVQPSYNDTLANTIALLKSLS